MSEEMRNTQSFEWLVLLTVSSLTLKTKNLSKLYQLRGYGIRRPPLKNFERLLQNPLIFPLEKGGAVQNKLFRILVYDQCILVRLNEILMNLKQIWKNLNKFQASSEESWRPINRPGSGWKSFKRVLKDFDPKCAGKNFKQYYTSIEDPRKP